MSSRLLALAAAMLVSCTPVFAQEPMPEPGTPGTAGSAAALQAGLVAYLTALPFDRGIVRVEPDPIGERITIAPAEALGALVGSPVRFAPLSFVVSRRDDGNWNVFSRDRPDVAATPEIEGQAQRFEYRQEAQHFKGVFSPELGVFLEGEGAARGTTSVQGDAVTRSTTTVGSTTLTTSARPGAEGGTDLEFNQSYQDYRQTNLVTLPAGEVDATKPDAAPASFGFEVNLASVETSGTAKSAQTRAIRDLYALVIRNVSALSADAEATLAGPFGGELRDALRAALPLWLSLDAEGKARDVKLTSLYGELALAEAAQSVRMTGVATDSGVDVDLRLGGLQASSPLLPPWAATLVPEEIALGFAVSGADLRTAADIALEGLDFSQDPPLSADAQARLTEHFSATRLVTRLKPSRIRAEDFDVTFSGDVALAGLAPAANITVEGTGLDRTIATLQGAAATQPELYQAVGFLQFAKGFGRSKGEDRFEWVVAVASDGSVTVNGTTVKGPDPVANDDAFELLPPDDAAPSDEAPDDADEVPPVSSQPSPAPKGGDL